MAGYYWLEQPSYRMIWPGVVEITDWHGSWRLNRDSVEIAIVNVALQRKSYATEDAWQRELRVYQGALKLIDSNH